MLAGKHNLFVDTSGWIEIFGKNNPCHKMARKILDDAVKTRRPIITTNYIITEFVGTGGRACNLARNRLFEAVDGILGWPRLEMIHISKESHDIALVLLRGRLDKNWSLVDTTSFNLMRSFGITEVLTTDHHFEQAGFIKLL